MIIAPAVHPRENSRQKRAPGRMRVAWLPMLAASCLTLIVPIRGHGAEEVAGDRTA
jgi:hypothetical protein